MTKTIPVMLNRLPTSNVAMMPIDLKFSKTRKPNVLIKEVYWLKEIQDLAFINGKIDWTGW
jgi:hypothetical protein